MRQRDEGYRERRKAVDAARYQRTKAANKRRRMTPEYRERRARYVRQARYADLWVAEWLEAQEMRRAA
jgi:hypothetical protein